MSELERLERLRQSGGLSHAEFEQAKAKLLTGTPASGADARQLANLEREVKLVRLDRAWELEKQSYMVQGRHEHHIPSADEGIWTAIITVCGGGGLIWFWSTLSSDDSGSRVLTALVMLPSGVFGIVMGIWSALDMHHKATHYEARKRIYFEQREDILQRR